MDNENNLKFSDLVRDMLEVDSDVSDDGSFTLRSNIE